MRQAGIAILGFAGALWIIAVGFGIIAGPLHLTERHDLVGRIARVCRAVFLLSPPWPKLARGGELSKLEP